MPESSESTEFELRLAIALAEVYPRWEHHKAIAADGADAVMKWIAERAVHEWPAPWASSLLERSERLLEARRPVAVEFVGWHLFEFVQNVVSHIDSPLQAEALRSDLGPLSAYVWGFGECVVDDCRIEYRGACADR